MKIFFYLENNSTYADISYTKKIDKHVQKRAFLTVLLINS